MRNELFWRPVRVASFIIGLGLVLSACEDREDIGLELQDEASLLGVRAATLDIHAFTQPSDSVLTSNLNAAQLGDLLDPVFGRTRAEIYTSLRLSALSPDFTDLETMDSLMLVFHFLEDREPYGTEELTQFSVQRLTMALQSDTTYYSTTRPGTDELELIHPDEMPFVPDHDGEVFLVGDTLDAGAQIRLRLDDSFAQLLIDEALNEPSAFDDLDDFQEYIKGLRVTAENLGAQGAIYAFDLTAADSELVMYYTDEEQNPQTFRWSINSVTPRFSAFTHDYSMTEIQPVLQDTALAAEVNYVQATAGLTVAIDVQSLLTFSDTADAIINKAELIVPADLSVNSDETPAPERLFALYYDEDSVLISVPDIFEGDAHAGGVLAGDSYRINITRFSQLLINGDISIPRLFIIPTGSATRANFVRLNGVESTEPLRLQVTYTEY